MKLNEEMVVSSARMSRCGRLTIAVGVLLFCIFGLFASKSYLPNEVQKQLPELPQISNSNSHARPWIEQPITDFGSECVGPRGGRMNDPHSEDLPERIYELHSAGYVDDEYPIPTYGTYDDLDIEKTWMTFDQRYGPYGYREEQSDYNFTKVDWTKVNWGKLQDQCFLSKVDPAEERHFVQVGAPPKFRFVREAEALDQLSTKKTGRNAIVLRTWGSYEYKDEDFWNVRSLITEASLATQGEFTVFLLVDIKRGDGHRIHEDDAFYRQVLEEVVPKEFWDIAVLFHKSLQESWYPKVDEYSPPYQIMQPFQLFAHFYPDFDTYWQVEMDNRFTGHAGEIARAFHRFGKEQPYKQSRERSSWSYIPKFHHSYAEFAAGVNESLKGGATVWGPLDNKVRGWKPVGIPPTVDPFNEPFELGVGEDADLLLFSPVSDIHRIQTMDDWPYIGWHQGIDPDVPRFVSFPAQAWASRRLLQAAHNDQHEFGMRVHSEATLPTFALWHGLKVVQVPMPKYQWPERDVEELNLIYNGGKPNRFQDGIAFGPAPYRSGAIRFFARSRTFEWQSSLVQPIWEHWLNEGDQSGKRLVERARSNQGPIPEELPEFMREVDGKIYMPPFMMHPKKTNKNKIV